MPIDVTNNPQYVNVKQSYDDQIDKDQKVKKLWDDYRSASADIHRQGELAGIGEQIAALDPDESITLQLQNDPNAIDKLQGTEATALSTLSAVLSGADDLQNARAQALMDTAKPDPSADIFTQVFIVMQHMKSSTELTAKDFMSDVSQRSSSIEELSGLEQPVRNAKASGPGTDGNTTSPISSDVIKELEGLGVDMPTDKMKLSDDGKTYSMPANTYDTILNNVQSKLSSLTTMNQDKSISTQQVADVVNELTTMLSQLIAMKHQTQSGIESKMGQ